MSVEQYRELGNKKAVGSGGITQEEYGKELGSNLELLLSRIRRGKYQAKPARITAVPKEDGGEIPQGSKVKKRIIINAGRALYK